MKRLSALVIEVNNERKMALEFAGDGIVVTKMDEKFTEEERYAILGHEVVMLLNYYQNCKEGREKSDYINETW